MGELTNGSPSIFDDNNNGGQNEKEVIILLHYFTFIFLYSQSICEMLYF